MNKKVVDAYYWMFPKPKYRLYGQPDGGCWDFADWETLLASIAYFRHMDYDLSTMKVVAL